MKLNIRKLFSLVFFFSFLSIFRVPNGALEYVFKFVGICCRFSIKIILNNILCFGLCIDCYDHFVKYLLLLYDFRTCFFVLFFFPFLISLSP